MKRTKIIILPREGLKHDLTICEFLMAQWRGPGTVYCPAVVSAMLEEVGNSFFDDRKFRGNHWSC